MTRVNARIFRKITIIIDTMSHALLYLEHLTDEDLLVLVEGAELNRDPQRIVALLRDRPELIDNLLDQPGVFEHLFGQGRDPSPYCRISPFLAFLVLIHHSMIELRDRPFTAEWTGPQRRLPVFEVESMRRFLENPLHRLYLAELLTSYTKVVSGAVWVQTRRGLRRQRFNEMDPLRLVALLDAVGTSERWAILRRLGDLALFLTGVFPDHAGRQTLRPQELQLLAQSGRIDPRQLRQRLASEAPEDPTGTIAALELMGGRWYRLAAANTRGGTVMRNVLMDIAEEFRAPRRVLNYIADRHLHSIRSEWFPGPQEAM